MEKKAKLPSIKKVKQLLHDHWALQVKKRDGWVCAVCGAEAHLTAHHWIIAAQRAHAARYNTDNGITLCYTCHIRSVHNRADWVSVEELRKRFMLRETREGGRDWGEILSDVLKARNTLIDTAFLRDAHKTLPYFYIPPPSERFESSTKGNKTYLTILGHRLAVPGYSCKAGGREWTVSKVSRTEDMTGYRYTLVPIAPCVERPDSV